MSQPFINNIPEVDWHGANGNTILGGDALASARYTECRLAPIVEEGMLKTIDKHNVDMIPNFSDDAMWPKVFPAIFPRLLVNGSQGIGVSLSQYWAPHNFKESADLIINYLQNNELNEDTFYPDFPTGGEIINPQDLPKINKTGKGKIIVDAKYKIQGNGIYFYEFPYQVYIEPLVEEIKKAIEENKINGIQDVSNRSDRKRILLVVECEDNPEKVLQYLFAETNLRKQYNVNQNGIISKTPILLNLQQYIDTYTNHNLTCIKKEFNFEYDKTVERLHILEGLIWAVQNIDEVIKVIREGRDLSEINNTFSDKQIKAILDMKLSRLSKLEEDKLIQEKQEKEKYAAYCNKIINSEEEQKNILIERLRELSKKFGTNRRTQINEKIIVKTAKTNTGKTKIVIPEDVCVSLTSTGYIKSVPVKSYRQNNTDINVFKCQTTDMILLFSSLGKVYRLKVNEIKQCNAKDKGVAAGSILKLENGEKILNIFSMNTNELHPYIVGFTKNGLVKKSEKSIYVGITQNKNGLKAATLLDGDEYIGWYECNGDYAIVQTNQKYILQFNLQEVSKTGKTSKGVIAIKLQEKDFVSSVKINSIPDKRFLIQKRAGKGKFLGKYE